MNSQICISKISLVACYGLYYGVATRRLELFSNNKNDSITFCLEKDGELIGRESEQPHLLIDKNTGSIASKAFVQDHNDRLTHMVTLSKLTIT